MKSENTTPLLLRGCMWCARPVQAPVSILQFVIVRVVAILLVFISMIGTILTLILLPWKIEEFEGRILYFGVWKICKSTPHETPYFQCFQEFYNDEEVEDWFYGWRNLMVVGSCLLFLSFVYLITMLTIASKKAKYAWIMAAFCCLFSSFLYFCAQIIFYIKFEFGFAEGARIVLDWTEETEIEEIFGYLYTVAWCIVGLMLFTSYFCYYAKCVEQAYYQQISENHRKNKHNKNGSFNNSDDFKRYKK